MSKPNKAHNEWCKKYKTRNQRAINKEKKQARHLRRLEKLKARRETGKTYVYKPNPYDAEKEPIQFVTEKMRRAEKVKDPLCEYQRLARFFGRLHRDVSAREEEWRKEQIKLRKTKIQPAEEVESA